MWYLSGTFCPKITGWKGIIDEDSQHICTICEGKLQQRTKTWHEARRNHENLIATFQTGNILDNIYM